MMERLDSFVNVGQEEEPAEVLLDVTPLGDSIEITSSLEIPSGVMEASTESSEGLVVSTVSSDGGLVMVEDNSETTNGGRITSESDTSSERTDCRSSDSDGVDGLS